MKVVNEKGKLFGIVNPVDLLIVLAIVLVVAAVGFKVLSKPVTAAVAPKSKVQVTMRVRGAMPYLVDEILRTKIGDKLVAGNDYIDATVEKMETMPYKFTTSTATGSVVESTDPVKKDVLITVKSSGLKDSPILKIGNQEVRIGRDFIFKTNIIEINAIIETVRFDG